METVKICFRCNVEKPLSEFYKHPCTKDGHLNKCKTCTKKDSSIRDKKIRSTPEGLESERRRGVEKYYRLYQPKDIIPKLIFNNERAWINSHIYKNLRRKIKSSINLSEDVHIHHWNYNLVKSVFIISKSIHYKIHRKIRLDEKTLCYYYDNQLLDTKEKHKKFILDYLEETKDDYKIIDIDIIENKLRIN